MHHQYSVCRDAQTNLIWMRCSAGQQWDGQTCTAQAKRYHYNQLQRAIYELNQQRYGGYSDWKVPHIEELATLSIYSSGYSHVQMISTIAGANRSVSACNTGYKRPTINQEVFSNSLASMYWS